MDNLKIQKKNPQIIPNHNDYVTANNIQDFRYVSTAQEIQTGVDLDTMICKNLGD